MKLQKVYIILSLIQFYILDYRHTKSLISDKHFIYYLHFCVRELLCVDYKSEKITYELILRWIIKY